MKLFAIAILIGISSARGMSQLEALAQIESGVCDDCHGPNGERGRTQISPAVCVEYHIDRSKLSDANYCLGWTKIILSARIAKFIASHHRQPTDAETYLSWHRPSRIEKPTPRERDRAMRFANLCARP